MWRTLLCIIDKAPMKIRGYGAQCQNVYATPSDIVSVR